MCTTCQDCSCDNITLPIAIGPAGPAGPPGSAGAPGSGSSTIIFSNLTQATINSLTPVDFSGMTYTLPINTLATNGSKLKINAFFTVLGASPSGGLIELYLDGAGITSNIWVLAIPKGASGAKVEIILHRKSTTQLYAEISMRTSDQTSASLTSYGHTQLLETTVTATDLSASTNIIKFRGTCNITEDINCELMTIELLQKS